MADLNLIRFHLDFQEKTPLAEQIRLAISQLISEQALLPGDQLPTVRQMALQLNVNFNTVARAYRWLDTAGQITTRQGRGTFVTEKPGAAPPVDAEAKIAMDGERALNALIDRLIADASQLGITHEAILAALVERIPWEAEEWIAPPHARMSPKKRFHPRGQHEVVSPPRKRSRRTLIR